MAPATKTPTRLSKWYLALQSYVCVVVTIAFGALAAAPWLYSQVRYYAETTYLVGTRPADDTALTNWALEQPNVVAFMTERRGEDLWIRSEYQNSATERPSTTDLIAQMRELGYEFRGMQGGSTGIAGDLHKLLIDPLALAAMLAGTQVALAFVGINRIRAANRRGEALAPLLAGHQGQAIVFGLLGGVGLLAIGLLYDFALSSLFGTTPPSPWDASDSMSTQTKIVFLAFGALGAPIAEEIFFRGYLFARFKSAGYLGFGMIFTALLFAAMHFTDRYNVPCIFLFGLCLAGLYHHTGSLLAPITAHMVNNGIAILWMILS